MPKSCHIRQPIEESYIIYVNVLAIAPLSRGLGFAVPQAAERRENHTLMVRETARMFEAVGVARTERSIIKWCQPNRQGIAQLV